MISLARSTLAFSTGNTSSTISSVYLNSGIDRLSPVNGGIAVEDFLQHFGVRNQTLAFGNQAFEKDMLPSYSDALPRSDTSECLSRQMSHVVAALDFR